MSENALRDLKNTLPASDLNESSLKGSLVKSCVGNGNKNTEERASTNVDSLLTCQDDGVETVKPDAEVAAFEIEYVDSKDLSDVEDPDTSIKELLLGLDSKDWILVCEALNNVRRLSIFHKEKMITMLGEVIPLVVKSMKNPRSALCKTAIMTSADIFSAYSDHMIDSLDILLTPLLLKSSQDKRFVCEAAEKALVEMTTVISPLLLLPKLQPYFKHKNPRIRAKAAMCFCRSVPLLGAEGIREYGIDKLIQVAASQLSDKLPESREAARTLLLELQTVYDKSEELQTANDKSDEPAPPVTETENPDMSPWVHFCQSKLSPLSAQAVIRVTNNTPRDGLVVGS